MSAARVRATVQLLESAAHNAQMVESLGAGTPVEILEDQGAWLRVKTSHSEHEIPGWVPREALAFPPKADGIFPAVKLDGGKPRSSVPLSLKAADVQAWKTSAADEPAWMSDAAWGKVSAAERKTVKDGIRSALETHQAEWDAWLANVAAEGRQDEARLEEWLVTLQGGRDVWSVRAEMIYTQASQTQGHLGWADVNDILRWTGRVKRNDQEAKYKIWYEVSLYKSGKLLNGWYKGDLLDPYVYPAEAEDTAVEENQGRQFDLGESILRHPADPEIDDAIEKNRTGYQYIDVFNALGARVIHFNLCGEFCAAALAGVDVIPFLQKWKEAYPEAEKIMRNNLGTGLGDVKSMLELYDLKFEEFRYTPSLSPVSPVRLRRLLEEGKMVFWGVAIFKSDGRLSGKSTSNTTRHWIVLEDVIPVGNNGWVRIYNPFRNREEVYVYNYFIESVGQFGIGLLVEGWVRNKPQQAGEAGANAKFISI
ncbi:MAG: hypothetical protein DPW18_06970 [Chloroflexi bacterium]|nr:hypothetical protein [Chloroflexota bacterium]MDL1941549.1 hypothetical protein [Chloroflexi bacterium CFX2]